MMRGVWPALVCLLWVAAVSSSVVAAQLLVAQDGSGGFGTIQGALNAAVFGDVIHVGPGIYEEGLTFKNGVTLIGSGQGETIVRHGYGFDPVIRASHASVGRIEGITVERTGITLSAPAVLLEAASITISSCTITGAQESGIEIADSTSSPTIERVRIVANAGHGVWAHDGARVRLTSCEIRGNGGTGLLLTDNAQATVFATELSGNRAQGLVLTDSATASLVACDVRAHARWGIELSGRAQIELADSRVAANAEGGVLLMDDSEAVLTRCSVTSGAIGIAARDTTSHRVVDSAIRETTGSGLVVEDDAGGLLLRSEIAGCGSNGLTLSASSLYAVDHSTVVRNDGSGVLIQGAAVTITNTIVAYNGLAGIGVDRPSGDPSDVSLSHNNLWANGSADYEGITRRPSDLSKPPEFVDLIGGDLSLRPESPCIAGGAFGATIGAHSDPAGLPTARIELSPTFRRILLGLDLSTRVRFEASPFVLETVELSTGHSSDRLSFALRTSVAGSWGLRASGEGRFETLAWRFPSGTLTGRASAAGVLDGIESWLSIALGGDLVGPWYSLSSQLSRTWPSTRWVHEVDLSLGTTVQAMLSARTADLSPEFLGASIDVSTPVAGGTLTVGGALALGPDRLATASADWSNDARAASAAVFMYIDSPGHVAASLSLSEHEAGIEVSVSVRIADGAFDDGTISVTKRFDAASLSARLGVDGDGRARLALHIEADFYGLLAAPQNLLPVPSFAIHPTDPHAGEPVTFDPSASSDADGQIVEYWWDFGDGEVELGEKISHIFGSAGVYDVALTVGDDAGAAMTIAQSIVIWESDSAPVADFTWEPVTDSGTRLPRPLRAGDTIRLDASASYDRGGQALEYHWDLDSDGAFDLMSADPIALVPPLQAGSHPVTLRVINEDGRAGALMHALAVGEPKPPRADFAFTPVTPSILDPVRFAERSSDSDGEVIAWEWAFGDGRASREREPIHQYAAPGDYSATLTVTDDDGLDDTYEETITVGRIPEIVPVDDVWVLAIGISDYESVTDLEFASADAIALTRWALDEGLPIDHIRLLTDTSEARPDLEGMETRRATLVNVRESLGWLRKEAERDDLVMIFFSGHGYQGLDDGSDERDGVDEFFVLADTVDGAIDDTALRDDEFGRFLDRVASEHVLVFFDGCYSGGLARSLPSGARPSRGTLDLFRDFSLEGRLVLSATSETQDAFESPTLGHGVFTHFVLEGLRGSADLNGDTQVTAWEIYEYVLAEVPPFVREERGADQIPQIVGEGDVRVLVATDPRPLVPDFSFAPTVPFAGGPVAFLDETTGETASREWSFGDGSTSTDLNPTHVYSEPGDFRVSLVVTSPAGIPFEASIEIPIAPAGRITGEEEGVWIVSLGSRNGIRAGHRLSVLKADSLDPAGTLEVTELLDADAAACRITDSTAPPAVGDLVRPTPSAHLP